MKTLALLVVLLGLLIPFSLKAQNVAITDDDTYVANSTSMLDVKSTTKGLLIPRLSTAQRVAIISPATGLLVFDTSLNGFYYYNGTTWINLSSGSSSGLLWSYSSPYVYLTTSSDKVGIGTSAPLHKLSIADNVTITDGTDGSFIDIQNQSNSTGVLSGIRFYNGTTANTYKGGIFYKDALANGRGDLILANNSVNSATNVTATDSRLTIKNTGGIEVKATTGAASNASLFHVLNATGDTIFAVYDGGVRINVYDDPLVKATGSKGGFAVGGFSPAKGTITNEYLRITPDSIRMYIEEGAANKATGSKGGFAVGGFSPAKAIPTDYFNIYGATAPATINPSQPRIFWYPLKEALISGRVLVQSPDSVGLNSFSTGYQSKAIGNYSQAMGYSCIARGMYSTAIGKNALANKSNSFAFGGGASAYGPDAYAFGSGAQASGTGSYAIGSLGRDSLGSPTASPTKATGSYSMAFGMGALASGMSSMSFGINSNASGDLTTALGFNATASGKWSISLGKDAEASGTRALSIGSPAWFFGEIPTRATGDFSTAIGPGAQATNSLSTAIGPLAQATGSASIALGVTANASNNGAIAGPYASASGENAVSFGGNSDASGSYAVAIGNGVTASGLGATSFGTNSNVTGMYAAAVGKNIINPSYNSFIVGRYNLNTGTTTTWVATEPLFVVANGADNTNRNNAFTVLKNGKTGIGTATPSYMLHSIDNQASNDNPAVYGEHYVTDNYGIGVQGFAKWKGVYGVATSASSSAYGVYGLANGTGTGTRYGVYGSASGGATAYAGYFSGNVNVTGTLSKGGGSFKIDHPLDPENKYLYHSFVESPDMKNIYDGVAVLNANGEATITMPNWFEVLNKDFRYQLTTIGGYAPVYIKQKLQNNQFIIAGGTSGMEVSWMITGIRKDPFAEQNRIPVEVEKTQEEKGFYLYPDVYGKSQDKAIDKINIK